MGVVRHWQIPYYVVEGMLQPVTSTIIRVSVSITCDYDWSLKVHGPVALRNRRDD